MEGLEGWWWFSILFGGLFHKGHTLDLPPAHWLAQSSRGEMVAPRPYPAAAFQAC